MRWLALAAFVVLTPGCLEAYADSGLFAEELDCSDDVQVVDEGWAEVLFPAAAPDEVQRQAGEARVTISAREGQGLTIGAVWDSLSGAVDVQFDGPPGDEVLVDQSWSYTGTATETRDYTFELVGDPMAVGVGYAGIFAAFGCTPAG